MVSLINIHKQYCGNILQKDQKTIERKQTLSFICLQFAQLLHRNVHAAQRERDKESMATQRLTADVCCLSVCNMEQLCCSNEGMDGCPQNKIMIQNKHEVPHITLTHIKQDPTPLLSTQQCHTYRCCCHGNSVLCMPQLVFP